MSENDTMFNERNRRCAAEQLILSTDPSYDNKTIASTLKMQIWIATVTWHKIFIPRREFIFRTCEVGAVWHLIHRKISSS